LEIAERAPGGAAEGGRVLALLAEVERLRKDEAAAAEALERLLAETTDPRAALALHVRLGLVLAEAGAVDAAAKHLAQAEREAAPETRDRALLSLAKANLAAHTGRAQEARLLAQEAAGLAHEAGDIAVELDCLAASDRWDARAGQHAGRAPALRRTLELTAEAGDLVRAAETCAALAGLPGEPLEVRDSYAREAHEHFVQLGDDAGRARSLRALARLRLEAGDLDEAERMLGEALALAREQDAETESGHALYLLGHTALQREDLPTAEAYLAEALASSDPAEPHLRARCLVALARLAARAGEDETARARIADADAAVGNDCARCVAQLSVVAAELALTRGDLAEARARWSRGLECALRGELTDELVALGALAEQINAPV
jgi:tetratricopeptide (TPR) repeat protein